MASGDNKKPTTTAEAVETSAAAVTGHSLFSLGQKLCGAKGSS